jgi:hypothetical protein
MVIKYINIFQSNALKIYPNSDFWFENKPSGNPADVMWSAIIGFSVVVEKSGGKIFGKLAL